jgi:hypothetical protein
LLVISPAAEISLGDADADLGDAGAAPAREGPCGFSIEGAPVGA